jgi:regulator of cell morphogenesis and NO signaling
LDIILCEQDLNSHCSIEDNLFVPAAKELEKSIQKQGKVMSEVLAEASTAATDKIDQLSDREKEIVVCIAKGMSNKEIADALFLSVHTVTTHRKNISAKLQIHSTAGLVIYAIANKLVAISEVQ